MAPLPVPELPDVIVSQASLLVAVQASVGSVSITWTEPDPPAAPMLAVLGLRLTDAETIPHATRANASGARKRGVARSCERTLENTP